jgi:hypothetical protein
MRLLGLPISDVDMRGLVASLVADDEPAATELAGRIARALELRTTVLALSPVERDLILLQLEEPPEGLAELRGALLRDHHDRTV